MTLLTEQEANAYFTRLLQSKCDDSLLRVMRIRPGMPGVIEVALQRDSPDGSGQSLGTIPVPIPLDLEYVSCFETHVLDAVASEFPCDKLPKPEPYLSGGFGTRTPLSYR